MCFHNFVELTLYWETAKIDIDTVSSCGLLVNGLVENSYKDIFPQNKKGPLPVRIKNLSEKAELIITDGDSALPNNFKLANGDSFGSILISFSSFAIS